MKNLGYQYGNNNYVFPKPDDNAVGESSQNQGIKCLRTCVA